jgi:hypothetical protein
LVFLRIRWLTVHQIIGTLILLNAAFVLVPVGRHLLDVASKIIQGSGSMEAFASLSGWEHMFGALNLILAVVTIFVAMQKPRLGQSRH